MNLKSLWLAGAAFAASAAFAGTAGAVAYSGNSSGTFTDPPNCFICFVSNSNTQLNWGSISDPSTLRSVATNFAGNTDANDVVIAELRWHNEATFSAVTPDFNSTWTLSINITLPSPNVDDSEAITISVDNTANPTGDTITLGSLAGVVLSATGITISDIKYLIGPGGGTLTGNQWFNPEERSCGYHDRYCTPYDGNSTLYITADFREIRRVPEPASIALLGAGLAGLGFARRRKAA